MIFLRRFLPALGVLYPVILFSAEKLYLNPSSECGIFTTIRGEWVNSEQSQISVSYDDKNLYMEGTLKSASDGFFVLAGKNDDDTSIFDGDVVECQIAPAKQSGVYYHFALSPSGHLYSAKQRDRSWDPKGVIRSVKIEENAWKYHLAIPFRALGEDTPSRGDVWKINLGRTTSLPGKRSRVSSLSGARDFHNVDQYTDVVFGVSPATRPIVLRGFSRIPTGYSFQFSVPENFPNLKAKLVLDGETVFSEIVQNKDGKLAFSVRQKNGYVPLKATPAARVTLQDPTTGKEVFHKEGQIDLSESDTLRLDRFYYTLQDQELRYSHLFTGGKVALRVIKDGRVLRTFTDAPSEGIIPFAASASAQALTSGRYVLEVTVETMRTSRVFFILDKPPVLPEISDNALLNITDKGFEREGTPVYLLGITPTPKAFLQFTPAFNLAYAEFGNQKNAVRMAQLPGAPLIREPFTGVDYPSWDLHREKIDSYLAAQDPAKPTLHRIAYEADKPVVGRNADGTLIPQDSNELMSRIYAHAKQVAPGLIFTIQTDDASKVEVLSKFCDAFEVALYSSSYEESLAPQLRVDMGKVAATVPFGKPVIFWLGGTIPNVFCRVAEELRYGVYLSLVYGFSGNIIHLGHGFLPEKQSRLWSLISGIHAEVQRFYPDLIRGKDAVGFVREAPQDSFVWKAVDTGDGILLLILNTSSAENMLGMRVNAKSVRMFDAFDEMALFNGEFKSLFTPYEPKVFLFKNHDKNNTYDHRIKTSDNITRLGRNSFFRSVK